jgi:hypothetical protein
MFEELVPLEPVHFFALHIGCHQMKGEQLEKKHLFPTLSSFYKAPPFATLSLGWQERGIFCAVQIEGAFDRPSFPHFVEGDSVELFFDTRDVKTTGYTTRFCHHFYFLPYKVADEEVPQAGEITRFRTEDLHELCDPALLQVETIRLKKGSLMKIFIPSESLHGYDPLLFDRLGFTYRINRIGGFSQNFSASGSDFAIESYPSVWASLKLIKSG